MDIKEALKLAMWYNGLHEPVKEWLKYEPNEYGMLVFEDQYNWKNMDGDDGALQLIWMICVLLFGDYGTSPRFGWIEDVKGFRAFIEDITKEETYE